MRRIAIMAVSLITLLLFAGCTGNLFMQWDKPNVPSVSEINDKDVTTQSGADDFLSDAGDWYEGDALSGEKDSSEAVVSKLKQIYDDPTLDDKTRQEAAALAGKVAIQSDPNAEQLSKNLIASFDELSSADSTTAEELLRSIIPQEVLNDQQAFNDMIDTLISASDAFLALGESINTNGTYISDGELGDSVQLGAVSVAVEAALDAFDGSFDGNYTSADYDSLYSIVRGDASYSTDYPTAANPMDAFEDNDVGTIEEYDGIVFLLDAAGLSFS